MHNQRKNSRKECLLETDWTAGKKSYRGIIRNISAGGAFVDTGETVSDAGAVELVFSLSDGDERIAHRGRVAWDGPGGFGVAWVVPFSALDRIQSLNSRLAPRSMLSGKMQPPRGDGTVLGSGYWRVKGLADDRLGAIEEALHRSGKALEQSEARYRRLFDNALLGIFQSTVSGKILMVNPALARMFGYASPDELTLAVGETAEDLYADPADRRRIVDRILASDAPVTTENLFRRRDGSFFTGNFQGWKVTDEQHRILFLEGFIEDISARKHAEADLRFSKQRVHHLSSRLLKAQEDERRRISMEIHDDIGQNLTVIKLRVQSAASRLRRDQGRLTSELEQTLEIIDETIEKTRKLTRDISPSIIEDLQLADALRWMVRNFAQHADIRISLSADRVDKLLDRDSQVLIYRIIQEALNNILKHAGADNVAVSVRREGDRVIFVVVDDGDGFDPEAFWRRHIAERGMGLAAMQERARMLGGELTIDSRPGCGTRITLLAPVCHPEGGS